MLFSGNYHLTAGNPGYDRMTEFLAFLSHRKVFQGLRDRKILWEYVCVGDAKALRPRPGRTALGPLLEGISGEDLDITVRVVDFRGRELRRYDKVPMASKFLQEVLDLSEKNDRLYAMSQKASAKL